MFHTFLFTQFMLLISSKPHLAQLILHIDNSISLPHNVPPPRCSRSHPRLTASPTLLIPNMFQDIALVEQALEDRDNDVSLEVGGGGRGVCV